MPPAPRPTVPAAGPALPLLCWLAGLAGPLSPVRSGGASAVSICPSPRAQLLRPQLTGGRAEPGGGAAGTSQARGAGLWEGPAEGGRQPGPGGPSGQRPLCGATWTGTRSGSHGSSPPRKGAPPRLLLGTWGRVLLASGGWGLGCCEHPTAHEQLWGRGVGAPCFRAGRADPKPPGCCWTPGECTSSLAGPPAPRAPASVADTANTQHVAPAVTLGRGGSGAGAAEPDSAPQSCDPEPPSLSASVSSSTARGASPHKGTAGKCLAQGLEQ